MDRVNKGIWKEETTGSFWFRFRRWFRRRDLCETAEDALQLGNHRDGLRGLVGVLGGSEDDVGRVAPALEDGGHLIEESRQSLAVEGWQQPAGVAGDEVDQRQDHGGSTCWLVRVLRCPAQGRSFPRRQPSATQGFRPVLRSGTRRRLPGSARPARAASRRKAEADAPAPARQDASAPDRARD